MTVYHKFIIIIINKIISCYTCMGINGMDEGFFFSLETYSS